MIKYFLSLCSILTFTGLAALQYDIQDIGTLQTKTSEPIAINAKGQILGKYAVEGVKEGKHYFVRDRNGKFNQLPIKDYKTGWEINWRYLNDNGQAFGTFDGNANYSVLYMWDKPNGIVNLGNLPSKEIMAINNSRQVLLKSIVENEYGRSVKRPAIWIDGVVKTLRGLESEMGIESDESYGFDMNNKGDVVGQSISHRSYKNEIYDQVHAVKWTNGEVIDLHNQVPKNCTTKATLINDHGDTVVCDSLIRVDGKKTTPFYYEGAKKSNKKYFLNHDCLLDREVANLSSINVVSITNSQLASNYGSIWLKCNSIIGINDTGEIIALGTTIYNETHAMLLVPKP